MAEVNELLKNKILLLDGGMGTVLQKQGLKAEDFSGEKYEGCNEHLNLTRPDIIGRIHDAYLEAGADIIETNTFAGSSITLAEYGLQDKDYEINLAAAKIARKAADRYSTEEQPRFVAGSIGPTNKTISVTGNITFEELESSYYRQAKALLDGNVDILLVETVFDTLNAKAAFSAICLLFEERQKKVPLMLSATIERNGTMLAGQNIESFYVSMEHNDLAAVGMNCGMGPDLMRDHLRTLNAISKKGIICYPNAGIPLEDGSFPQKPRQFAELVKEFIDSGWVNIIGGCCGTTPDHISEIRKIIDHSKRRKIPDISRTAVSGLETAIFEDDNRPLIVGERTNTIGSRKFKDLIASEDYDIASEIGALQVKKGAQIIDVCLANPDSDEIKDTVRFYERITKKVKVPIMIDSTDPKVIEVALKSVQGKCIINSLNFEDGTERIDRIMPLVKKFGAAVIFGTIDEDKEQAMALTAEKKLEIAKRAYKHLTEAWEFSGEDIIFDALAFPIATGDKKYAESANETLKAIAKIKQALPKSKTILGISNVSFGLPASGRETLNSVYLYHATKAGLDSAIVNSEKIIRYPSISEEEKKLAECLLYNKNDDPITPFVSFFRKVRHEPKNIEKMPLDQRLKFYIIEGRKEGLIGDLDNALKGRKPLEIINGPLMEGMDVVGKLFNENKLIVSEVLQSAESMKTAVSHLEQFMEKADEHKKGKIILATVKGDVHDIGKNLVNIIFKNNGFEIIDLGIKVPPEALIEAYHKHKADIIGLSGLLVKSTQMMVITAEDFEKEGLRIPLIVGGAALSKLFVVNNIATKYNGTVAYAKDAMEGLSIVKKIISGNEDSIKKHMAGASVKKEIKSGPQAKKIPNDTARSPFIKEAPPRKAPDLEHHIIEDYDLREIFEYLNPVMLYNRHLGLRGSYKRLIGAKDQKALKLKNQVEEAKEYIIKNRLLKPKAVFQFFECNADKNSIIVYKNGKIAETLEFERQAEGEKLCVSDFVAGKERGTDSMGIFVTTAGEGVMEKTKEFRDKGEYIRSHMISVLAIECAEAFAEIVHKKMRGLWGIEDGNLSKDDIFKAKYPGIRLSYGYPACPNLDDQKKLFGLIKPEVIGIHLTEGMMMEPEASVSALVFHHPQGKYFNV